MSLFVISTTGDKSLLEKNDNIRDINAFDGVQKVLDQNDQQTGKCEVNDEFEGIQPPKGDITHIIEKVLSGGYEKSQENESVEKFESLADFMRSAPWRQPKPKRLGQTDIEKEMQNSKLRGIESKKADPCLSDKKLKMLRRKERKKTKGKDWFDMPATEVTEEIRNDLKILQMRSALDPKHFYKKNDLKVLPKYFQVGTVQHSPLEYYNERDTRKNKKKTIVEELLADAEFQKYNKRKFREVMQKKQQTGYKKAVKKMKKLKKKK